jgi:UDP:flavonoid glycosyltransferase YjiC (YdhE family)
LHADPFPLVQLANAMLTEIRTRPAVLGRGLHRLGAASRPVPASRLTADRLVAAIEKAMSSASRRRRTAEVNARIADERGYAAVADALTTRRR